MSKELEFGQTPFDHLTPEEMRLELCRSHSALTSARSVLRASSFGDESPYWKPEGVGGNALSRVEAALARVEEEFESGSVYHSLFRYANDLLFPSSPGSKWYACPQCKQFVSALGTSFEGHSCAATLPKPGSQCSGTLRALRWEDLGLPAEPQSFFRVNHEATQQGLWYGFMGDFIGLIHGELSFCHNRDLKMDFGPELCGYLSAVKTLEELYAWFSREDIARLQEHGFYIHEYLATDFKWYERFSHFVINQESSRLIRKIPLSDPSHESPAI